MVFNRYNTRSSGFRIGPGAISPFIKLIIIINVCVYLLQWIWSPMNSLFGLNPGMFFSDFPNHIFQVFTYMFLHDPHSIFHLLGNMFMLWMFGTEIEYTWGTRAFARFYLIGGLMGGIFTLLFHSSSFIPTIGASGGVLSVMVAYWFMFPERLLYLYFLIPIKVKWAIPGFIIISLLLNDPRTAHMAHLGGAAWGVFCMKRDWRFFRLGGKLKNLRHRRQTATLHKRRREAEDIMKRVDSILDKINEVGIDNISKSDRKFLEDASSEISKKRENSGQ